MDRVEQPVEVAVPERLEHSLNGCQRVVSGSHEGPPSRCGSYCRVPKIQKPHGCGNRYRSLFTQPRRRGILGSTPRKMRRTMVAGTILAVPSVNPHGCSRWVEKGGE